MSRYTPHTPAEERQMLQTLGLDSMDALFADVPQSVLLKEPVPLAPGLSQMETLDRMRAIAERNARFRLTLRGAGCYDHFIPPLVPRIAGKEEFVTTYTPYQAEISQGVLQSIFEFQTLMCELTGMDVSNASVYDGATAAAESLAMCHERRRTVSLVSECVHPDALAVMKTYCYGSGCELKTVPQKDGVTDPAALEALLADDVSCLCVQQPNFFGQLEDVSALFAAAKAKGVKCVLIANPMTLALLPSGPEVGADVVCGDAQPFGLPMSYGGPSVGFITCTQALMRRLPGRIVGQTTDAEGRRAFVLTLQAREQHIRREKASSNICSNQAHCALTASIYLTYMGLRGVRQAAQSCLSKAHYLAARLCEIPGVKLRYPGEFFHEFVTDLPVAPEKVEAALMEHGVLSGLPVEGGMLWCATEKASREALDLAAALVKEACAQ